MVFLVPQVVSLVKKATTLIRQKPSAALPVLSASMVTTQVNQYVLTANPVDIALLQVQLIVSFVVLGHSNPKVACMIACRALLVSTSIKWRTQHAVTANLEGLQTIHRLVTVPTALQGTSSRLRGSQIATLVNLEHSASGQDSQHARLVPRVPTLLLQLNQLVRFVEWGDIPLHQDKSHAHHAQPDGITIFSSKVSVLHVSPAIINQNWKAQPAKSVPLVDSLNLVPPIVVLALKVR